jgi:methylmalonyl-CoA/ethylmalonyl-CoA epimerase
MNKLIKVGHIGWVVQDIDKSKELFTKFLGLKDWLVYDMAPPKLHDSICYGEKVEHSFRIASAPLGGFTLELIMPLKGKNVYSKFLKEKGEGLHHIGLTPFESDKELELVKEEYVSQGGKVIQSGRNQKEKGISHYYYIEKDALVLEMFYLPK